jgi:hypothetical protein
LFFIVRRFCGGVGGIEFTGEGGGEGSSIGGARIESGTSAGGAAAGGSSSKVKAPFSFKKDTMSVTLLSVLLRRCVRLIKSKIVILGPTRVLIDPGFALKNAVTFLRLSSRTASVI